MEYRYAYCNTVFRLSLFEQKIYFMVCDVTLRGFAKKEKFQKFEVIMEVGGWVQVSLGFFFFVENCPKIAINQYWYFGVVYHVYSVCIYIAKSCWLLWFECLSMSVMGFQKKVWIGVSSIQVFFGFLDFFNFAKPLSIECMCCPLQVLDVPTTLPGLHAVLGAELHRRPKSGDTEWGVCLLLLGVHEARWHSFLLSRVGLLQGCQVRHTLH